MRSEVNFTAISRMFSSSVMKEFSTLGRSPLFVRLVDQSGLSEVLPSGIKVRDIFDFGFNFLNEPGRRDDYVFRAAIMRKKLLGVHSLNTASMVSEFRVGTSRADLVLLNGTAMVFEIKSDLDTTARLQTQLRDYQRVFAGATVVTSELHADRILEVAAEDIGVSILNDRGSISVLRESIVDASRIDPGAVLDALRLSEAAAILAEFGTDLPDVPNTQIRSLASDLFRELDRSELHRSMVRTLKQSRSLKPLGGMVASLPASLIPVALSYKWKGALHQEKFIEALELPLARAGAME